MKIQNTFSSGKISKDIDGRFVPTNELIDAENAIVITSEGSNSGVLKNITGNIKKTLFNIPGAKTIGHGVLSSENKVYNFISGTFFDYIIETDTITWVSEIVCQSTIGQLLNFNPEKRMTNVNVIVNPEGNGNLLFFSGNGYRLGCLNIEYAKTWAIDGFSEDEISIMKPSPIFAPKIVLTTSVDGISNNFIEDKFICFSYRYKYLGGFYSAPGSWSKVAFEAKKFKLNYQTSENNGMLNLSNAVNISFNVGPREVIAVDLLFRESDTQNIYLIEQFKKSEQGWLDNSIEQFQFSKSKIFSILSEDQFLRNFDNVPLEADAQSVIGNRIAYANYLEGRNIESKIDFDVTLISKNSTSDQKDASKTNFVDVVSYSNIVDFEQGNANGGTSPINQMNYLTNEIEVDLTGDPDAGTFNIEVTPLSGYNSVLYNIYVKEGTTTLDSWIGVSGLQEKEYATGSNKNIKIIITSAVGLIYDLKLNYKLIYIGHSDISNWNYFAKNQLVYPNSTSYPTSLEGNTIISSIANFDLTGVQFLSGKQLRVNFELKSSLASNFTPSVTFFYNITEDYPSLSSFISGSSFKQQLEDLFSLNFKNYEISNAGTLISYQGFLVSLTGSILSIRTPKVVYNVTEPSGVIENKNEFYLINSSNFFSTNENGFASRHSNRDNEVGLIYLDDKGRKSTVLVCAENSIHIPTENSDLINVLSVKINNPPPSWAKYYKFAIKQTERNYDIIYANVVYVDGIYRWIKLIGGDKSKVSEGDLLIVKSDYSGPLETLQKVKILEIVQQPVNFISGNLISSSGEELKEEPGLYFKIKQGNFDINITEQDFLSFQCKIRSRYYPGYVKTEPDFGFQNAGVYTNYQVKSGSRISFKIRIDANGAIAFNFVFEKITIAQDDYNSVEDWFTNEIAILDEWNTFASNSLKSWKFDVDGKNFQVIPIREGTVSQKVGTEINFDINFSEGTLVFETEPIEQLNSSFFETPETYTITEGHHQYIDHVLNDAFNCFSFGNGVESYKIRDSITGKSFSLDSNPNGVNIEGYKQIRRYADITYSEVYNSGTNTNRLNEFNLSLANYKDDIEKSYGPIYKMRGKDTNLEIYQEDRDSLVFYGKDMLFNADGTSNLSRIKDVLGQQKVYSGEFGISTHSDSYDFYENTSYHTDFKRGSVIKVGGNGTFEISSLGMRTYFKKLFRDNTITQIIGRYDQFYDYYLLNIKYIDKQGLKKYVTWTFSDKINGWLTRQTFNPEDMCRVNSQFISFKKGEIWLHNQDTIYNTFYNVESASRFKFNYAQEPSVRKVYKSLSIEGTTPTQTTCESDLEKGYINNVDFEKKEGVWYGYIRGKNGISNTTQLSFQGIGNCTIIGLVLSFGFELDNVISIGDVVLNQNLLVVGTITNKTLNTLTLNSVENIIDNDYVLVTKPESIQKQGVLGYNLEVECEFISNSAQNIYSINAEVIKSFM